MFTNNLLYFRECQGKSVPRLVHLMVNKCKAYLHPRPPHYRQQLMSQLRNPRHSHPEYSFITGFPQTASLLEPQHQFKLQLRHKDNWTLHSPIIRLQINLLDLTTRVPPKSEKPLNHHPRVPRFLRHFTLLLYPPPIHPVGHDAVTRDIEARPHQVPEDMSLMAGQRHVTGGQSESLLTQRAIYWGHNYLPCHRQAIMVEGGMVDLTTPGSKSIKDKTNKGRISRRDRTNSGRISKDKTNNGNNRYPQHSKSEDRIRLGPIFGGRLTLLHPPVLREAERLEAKAGTGEIDNTPFFSFPPVKWRS